MPDRPAPTYGLLYRSQAAARLSDHDVSLLAVRSARKNAVAGLTGTLLHAEPVGQATGLFVQWLEGPERAVRGLYETIRGDARHLHCEVVAEGPTADLAGRDGRLFPEWDMHLVRLGELPVTLEGFLGATLPLRAA